MSTDVTQAFYTKNGSPWDRAHMRYCGKESDVIDSAHRTEWSSTIGATMPNTFSDIGFAVESYEALTELAQLAVSRGREVLALRGRYLVWALGQGEEIIVQVGSQNEILGCDPHFAGSGRVDVELEGLIERSDRPLEGYAVGWIDPLVEEDEPSEFPCVVRIAEFDGARELLQEASVAPTGLLRILPPLPSLFDHIA